MMARAVSLVPAGLLVLGSIAAQAQSFAPDMSNTRQFLQNFSATAGADIQRQYAATVDTSGIASLGTNATSLTAHKSANLQRIEDCRAAAAANFAGMNNQQKIDCQAVITAANIAYTPNPYLNTSSPQAQPPVAQSNVLTPAAVRSLLAPQVAARRNAATGAVTNPLNFTTTTACSPHSLATPTAVRLDQCRAEKPVVPTTCAIAIAATLRGGQVVTQSDRSACAAYDANPYCVPSGAACTLETMVDTGQVDTSGKPILSQVCVAQTQGYDCWAVSAPWNTANCSSLAANPVCAPTGVTVPAQLVSGQPVWQDVEYSCQVAAPTVATTDTCQTTICLSGTCFDATPKANQDFGSMAVGMEMMREAGVYANGGSADSIRIFQGVGSNCTRPTGIGIGANCCQASGASLMSNRDVLPSIAWQAAGSAALSAGRYGVQQASNYMYDFMFTNGGEWMQEKAFEALSSGAWVPNAGFDMTLGAYGFTMQIGTPTGSFLTGLMPADVQAMFSEVSEIWDTGSFELGGGFIGETSFTYSFNVYTLAATVAIQVLAEINSCTLDEKMLSARRGGNLCVKLGEYCSMELPWPLKTCIQITENWCCWDSRLAQTIAVQGGAQLGGGPRCGGFSPDELAQLDFSKIDFSTFERETLANVALPSSAYNAATTSQANARAGVVRGAIDPGATAAGVTDPSLRGYATGRLELMLNK